MKRRNRWTPELQNVVHTALQSTPCTLADLELLTGLEHEMVMRYVRLLCSQHSAHIAGWAAAKDGRMTVKMFAAGRKPNAPRPAAATAAQRMARTRAARKMK